MISIANITVNIINALNAAKIVSANIAPNIRPSTTAKATNKIPSIYSPQQRFFLGFPHSQSSNKLFSIQTHLNFQNKKYKIYFTLFIYIILYST